MPVDAVANIPGVTLRSIGVAQSEINRQRLSGVRHNYDDVRGQGFFAQTRRKRRAYPAVDLQGASNEVWVKKTCRPPGCAEFGLWLRCSSVTAPWWGCVLLAPRHRPNWAQRTSSYLCLRPLSAAVKNTIGVVFK